MTKWCYNYESGECENIDRNGYSYDQNEYVYNWDDSAYRNEEEDTAKSSLWDDNDDN